MLKYIIFAICLFFTIYVPPKILLLFLWFGMMMEEGVVAYCGLLRCGIFPAPEFKLLV